MPRSKHGKGRNPLRRSGNRTAPQWLQDELLVKAMQKRYTRGFRNRRNRRKAA